jgi:hypothetical protein
MKRRMFLSSPLAALSQAAGQDVTFISAQMRQALNSNLLGLWLSRSIDRRHGGYHINYGPAGEPNRRTTKMIVMQARQVWYSAGLPDPGSQAPITRRKTCLSAADHGYRFLRDQFWDRNDGGFYWEVDATGKEKIRLVCALRILSGDGKASCPKPTSGKPAITTQGRWWSVWNCCARDFSPGETYLPNRFNSSTSPCNPFRR